MKILNNFPKIIPSKNGNIVFHLTSSDNELNKFYTTLSKNAST